MSYDTKVYIYDEATNVVACHDDFYSDYTSLIEFARFCSGDTYFIVIDGYSDSFNGGCDSGSHLAPVGGGCGFEMVFGGLDVRK